LETKSAFRRGPIFRELLSRATGRRLGWAREGDGPDGPTESFRFFDYRESRPVEFSRTPPMNPTRPHGIFSDATISGAWVGQLAPEKNMTDWLARPFARRDRVARFHFYGRIARFHLV